MSRGRHFNSRSSHGCSNRLQSEFTHFVAKPARGRGNVTGAEAMLKFLASRISFRSLVLAEGILDFFPGRIYNCWSLVTGGEADCCTDDCKRPLLPTFPKPAIDHSTSDKCKSISIDTKNTPTSEAAHVPIQTSTYGINTSENSLRNGRCSN